MKLSVQLFFIYFDNKQNTNFDSILNIQLGAYPLQRLPKLFLGKQILDTDFGSLYLNV